jgi:2-oxoisovalerate ferredoxin oxidoreductase gamma subunit
LINGKKGDFESNNGFKVAYVDATSIALKNHLGDPSHPIVNTAILGAFSKVSGIVSVDSMKSAVRDISPSKINENVNAIEEAYEEVEVA